jgi:phosphatidylglycerol:prolipoprotein diacylglycerol transferase
MCSELFRIPINWGGVPIFGVGVLLAIWALMSAITFVGLVRRQGWNGEVWSSLPVMLLAGAVIVFLPRVFPDGFPVRGYGVMLLAGISAGVGLAVYRAQQAGLHYEVILSLAVWLVVSGVLGARLFHVIEYWDDHFAGKRPAETLLEIINIPEGGLVIYGGFIGAAAGFAIFVRKHRLPLLAMADLVAPSLAIGLALGRVGCLLNGCCYGGPTDWAWAVTFPKYSSPREAAKPQAARRYSPPYGDQASRGEMYGFRIDANDDRRIVITRIDEGSPAAAAGLAVGDVVVAIDGHRIESLGDVRARIFDNFEAQQPLQIQLEGGKVVVIPPVPVPARSRPVHPTQLYSAIDAGLLCWLLWSFYPFRRRDGEVLALLLTIHPVTRFLLEIIRTDEPAVFGTGMSISQNISVLLFAAGVALWWWLSKQPRTLAWPLVAGATPRKRAISGTAAVRPGRP